MKELTREQLKEQGFKKMLLDGADAQPYDWLHDSVFDDVIDIDIRQQEYEDDFIGVFYGKSDNLVCRVQWDEYKSDNEVYITPINNKDDELIQELLEKLIEGNNNEEDENYIYTLVSGTTNCIEVTFWKK